MHIHTDIVNQLLSNYYLIAHTIYSTIMIRDPPDHILTLICATTTKLIAITC